MGKEHYRNEAIVVLALPNLTSVGGNLPTLKAICAYRHKDLT